uniref:Alpha/kappa-conotoxin-like fe14.1 n=1 Tax=Conus ferrugineus TaxID=379542 RepID=CJE1_CONFR|nr:RecName: Full=Alpha/kappa-conotoxin-like fe14.1; Flags: Precursor [Conus ferrugineus]ABE27010.1 conotoxin fe14.1 precursor [Conus ferrugineus]
MPSVRSVTCCCLLWMMLSVQLVTPGSPGTAQLSGHRTARSPGSTICKMACRTGNGHKYPFCNCRGKRDVVSSSMAV